MLILIFFFEIRPRSHFIRFILILWDLEKFRIRGAPGGYTFYVGLRSNFACSLEMACNERYKKKLDKF